MQNLPSTERLLADIALLLESDVLAAVPSSLQHNVRVAANLCRILEREAASREVEDRAIGRDSAVPYSELERYRTALGLGADVGDLEVLDRVVDSIGAAFASGAAGPPTGSECVTQQLPDNPDDRVRLWHALVETVRADLAVCKPGYDDWTGQ